MDKNTVLAIVLSTVVLFAAMFVQQVYFMPKQQAKAQAEAENIALAEEQYEQEAVKALDSFFVNNEDSQESSALVTAKEELITVKTNKVEVVLSSKGGDVVSYKLLNHYDNDTKDNVQMVDNLTNTNRAFALSFGGTNTSIINDIFNVKVIDDKTIGFYRDYVTKDSLGNENKMRLAKLYTFKDDEYVFKLDITVDGGSTPLNIDGAAYTLRTSPQIGPHFDKKQNRYEVRQYLSYNGSKTTKKNISNKVYDKSYTWAGIAGKYFTILVMPENQSSMATSITTSVKSESDYENAQVFLTRNALTQTKTNDSYYIYVGPRSESELIKFNSQNNNAWGLTNVKFNQALNTSGMLSFIEVALKWCMEKIYMLVHNWGIAIIILTIILKLVMFPLNKSSAEGSIKMQALQPKMQAIQEKYKDTPAKMQEETQKLYKEAGYNPASGCLPNVLQMIILFAMYNVFNNYFEFRGASFISGWIDDLSRGDSILSWSKQIPLITGLTQNNLRLLPFIYFGSQLLNGKITQYGGAGGQNQALMKFMMYGMPILLFFLFYNVPSGLLLYWTVSNIFQMGQQFIINRAMKGKREALAKDIKPVNKNEAKFNGGKKKTR